MAEKCTIQLDLSCLLNVHFNSYPEDFTFVVNNNKFKTSRIVADLLSPKICDIHLSDPLINKFVVQTKTRGDFSKILNLINFNRNEIEEEDIPFISEVIEALGNKTIKLIDPSANIKLTYDNVFQLIKIHEKCSEFFSEKFKMEVDFISSHFYDLCEKNINEFNNLQLNTLFLIFQNENLVLTDEDQLLKFINHFYSINHEYSILYKSVNFVNVSSNAMTEFMQTFDPSEMNGELWNKISQRMNHDIQLNNTEKQSMLCKRYNKQGTTIIYDENKPFTGIFDYFQKKTNGKIQNEINFSYSKTYRPDLYKAENVVYNDDPNIVFLTDNLPNSWICFEFKNYTIIPTNYTIKSRNGDSNYEHPLNWVIEGSNDNDSWKILDSQNNCQFLNGPSFVHSFNISDFDSNRFKYIRMRQTGPNSYGNHYLTLKSFEIYGTLIKT